MLIDQCLHLYEMQPLCVCQEAELLTDTDGGTDDGDGGSNVLVLVLDSTRFLSDAVTAKCYEL